MTLNLQTVNGILIIGSNKTKSDGLKGGISSAPQYIEIPETGTNGQRIMQIGSYAFNSYNKIVNVFIQPSIEIFCEHCFHGCENLISINIPITTKFICDNAFDDCKKLKTVSFDSPSHLVYIGAWAFNTCTSLEYIYLPESLKSLGKYPFSEMTNINIFYNGIKTIKDCNDNNLFLNTKSYTIYVPMNGPSLICGIKTTLTTKMPLINYKTCKSHFYQNLFFFKTIPISIMI